MALVTAAISPRIVAGTAHAQTGAPTDQCTGPRAGDAGPCRSRDSGGRTYRERPYREPRAPTARERATSALNEGMTYFRNGQFDDAAASFERATKIDPYSTRAHEWLARSLAKLDRVEDALRAASIWKLQADRSGDALFFWGYLLLRYADETWDRRVAQQRYDELEADLTDAGSSFARARSLGVSLDQARYMDDALAEIRRRRAILEPLMADLLRTRRAYRDAHSANSRGLDLLDAGDVDGALRELERAMALYPKEPVFARNLASARNEKGRALFKAKEYAAALDEFSRALQLAPDAAAYAANVELARKNISYRKGVDAFDRGDYAGALDEFTPLLREDPANAGLADVVAKARKLRDEKQARERDDRKAGQALEQVRPALTAEVLRFGDALAQAEAAKAHGSRAVTAPKDEIAKDEASRPWDLSNDRVGSHGTVFVPSRSWKPEPPDRETPPMTEARTRAERAHADYARYDAALQQEQSKRDGERDLVKMSELKQKRSRADYEEKLAQKEYDEYRDRSAQKPPRSGSAAPSGFMK